MDFNPHTEVTEERVNEVNKAFTEAFAELIAQTESLGRPLIGDVYMDVSYRASQDALGQFFTPYPVTMLGAEMSIEEAKIESATVEDPISIADPTCGASRMQIAVVMAARNHREDVPVFVQGTDLDKVCAQMSIINLYLFQIPGRIYHANSLTQETFAGWVINPGNPQTPFVEPIDDPDRNPPAEVDSEPEAEESPQPVETDSQGDLSEFFAE